MRLRAWRGVVAVACTTLACVGQKAKTPAFALLDAEDAAQWRTWAKDTGWQVIVPAPGLAQNAAIDERVRALAAAVQDAIANSGVDADRVYLAGRGAASASVFYAASRMPDAWAAAFALGGSPQQAIDSGRIFAANFTLTPILWAGAGADDAALAEKWKAAGLNLEWRAASELNAAGAIRWLAGHVRAERPPEIDCETNSTAFGRCYWAQMTKFDASERNDVLPSTLIRPGSGATLDLGGFGYQSGDAGPGVLVTSLPPKYDGPLKMGDRIVELDGKAIANPRQYERTLGEATREKAAVILVERGKERKRIETRIALPDRPALITARLQAKYAAEENEIRIVTRTVTELRVTIPPEWVPATLYWNGVALEGIQSAGCVALAMEKEVLRSEKCK